MGGANSSMQHQPESDPKSNPPPVPVPDEDIEQDEDDVDSDGEEGEDSETLTPEDALFRRLSTERVPVRVHCVIIEGNVKTKHSVIEAEVLEIFRDATSFEQLLRAAGVANARLRGLEIFDSVNITLHAGPPEMPGSANVVIDVSEAKNPLTGDFGVYSKPEARSWSLEGSLKRKNLFGYGDLWDGSLSYGWGQTSEVSIGVSLPRSKGVRISLLSQAWLKLLSLREQTLGLALGLWSYGNHDLSYNLLWRVLKDPSQMSSHTVRMQLGHSLMSGLKHVFKIDRRDSPTRPTTGHALVSTTQIGGLFPDMRSLRFFRQEFDFRYAIPLGSYRSALNLGFSGGVLLPLGNGFLNTQSYLPERFFMGGNSSPVCSLRGPTSVLGFKARGMGPAEPRRSVRDNADGGNPGVDHVGGDVALTAIADLSFDLPLKVCRDAGIHGHIFACTGSLNRITEKAYKGFSWQKLRDSFRSSVGVGIVVPTKLFRMEVNYCHILKQQEHDQGKTGFQFSFSSPL